MNKNGNDSNDELDFEDAVESIEAEETINDIASPISKISLSEELNATVVEVEKTITYDKKQLKAKIAQAEESLDLDIQEVEKCLLLFINSQFNEAEALLKTKYRSSMYFTLGYATISYLKALMTFEPAEIVKANDAIKSTIELAVMYRKESSLVGTVFGFVKSKTPTYRAMSKLQKHADLVYAEAYLLKAVLSALTDTNFVAFIREGLNIRASYSSYKSMFAFIDNLIKEVGVEQLEEYGVDKHFVSGVLFGIGTFNLVFSLLPNKILRIFEIIGFSGDRTFALNQLEIGGGWPSQYHVKNLVQNGKKNKVKRNAIEDSNIVASSKLVSFGGLRKVLCDLDLVVYHVVLSSVIMLPDPDLEFGQHILEAQLKKTPQSFIFKALRGHFLQITAKPLEAIAEFQNVILLQNDWKQLHHLCYWDMSLCSASTQNWLDASNYLKILFEESNWSKAVYRYGQAAYQYMSKSSEKETIAKYMAEVPKLTKKIAGKSIPIEV